MLTGDNSILTKAGEAKTTYEESAFKEQLEIEVLGNYSKEMSLNSTLLKENIEKNISNSNVITDELPLIVKNTKTNTAYLIDTDGTVMLYDENAVARIKDNFYETLQLAINAVPIDNTENEVILLKDTAENVLIKANQNVKLNLNYKTVSGTNSKDYTISTGGTLTINGNGKVTGTTIGIRCWGTGNLKIIDGTYEGTTNAVRATDNSTTMTLEGGTYNSQYPVQVYGMSNTTINGGIYLGTAETICTYDYSTLLINGGNFSSDSNSALHLTGNSNIHITNGIFNSSRTNSVYDGVIQFGSSGTLTIGNLGDTNSNIIVNNNDNKNICGIYIAKKDSTTIINSGIIQGYCGINIEADNSNLYLNGGTISGIGETIYNWSCSINSSNSSNIVYLKNNSSISLNGGGQTGKNSINLTNFVIDMD